jgi:hypothetical protein
MSKKEVLSKEEIAQVQGAIGEIAPRYLSLRAENTKGGNTPMSEIGANYLSLRAESTKNAH